MNTLALKKIFPLFYSLTAVTVIIRFVLQFVLIDPETGFYYATSAGQMAQWGFNLLLALAVVLLCWFSRTSTISPSAIFPPLGKAVSLSLIVSGLLCELGAFFALAPEILFLLEGDSLTLKIVLPALINLVMGLLLIYLGFLALGGKQNRISLTSAVLVLLWSIVLLISNFLSYPIAYHVSDNMLHILALVCMAFLMVAFFKALLGVSSQKSLASTLRFGLLTAYLGVVLVLPRLVAIWTGHANLQIPAPDSFALYLMLALAAFGYFAARNMLLAKDAPAEVLPSEDASIESVSNPDELL